MTSPFGPLVLIANPMSGRGKVGRHLPEIERLLREEGMEHRIVVTSHPGHATEAARDALEQGERFVVAAGGDGTVNEVVNGMVADDRPVAEGAVLGVVAAGSGCDFIKTFELPGDTMQAAHRLKGDATVPIDVGKVTYAGGDGSPVVRYFPNIAEAGLGGAVCRRVTTLPRRLGPTQYFFGFWMVLPGFAPTRARIDADGQTYDGRAVNIVVANCRFFGGGMQISPKSSPDDGFLDVLVMTGPKLDSFTTLPKVYKGTHLPHRNIVELRGRRITVETDEPLPIEADGEPLGSTPATFEVVARPLRLKV
jgi:diacylglycerol kinase (ATP)